MPDVAELMCSCAAAHSPPQATAPDLLRRLVGTCVCCSACTQTVRSAATEPSGSIAA